MQTFTNISRMFVNTVRLTYICASDEMMLLEHWIPDHCRRLTKIKKLLNEPLWKAALLGGNKYEKPTRKAIKMVHDLEKTLHIHYRVAVERYYFTSIDTPFD
ncbi:Oidioi.mRNA.OKI2018_I69.chr1.g437.t1.cds [Oikopleura dioica]|uniref:Oidioi.mRNA.OKI2018_I69.chr1.g437.t1.cds n=1 Tax=Oikopleura dioica TaxID=34765 RepID=A0ABN7SJU5_OIKDI|nr:Oidioi.mRNA.OKI2018_I69.chr1.g437.t1.cds [Oikopleura dioica]